MHNDMALFVEFQGCAPMFPHSQQLLILIQSPELSTWQNSFGMNLLRYYDNVFGGCRVGYLALVS